MIKLIQPYIEYEEVEADLRRIFETKQFTKGPYVQTFIEALSDYTKARYVHLTSSATTALSTCLTLLNIQKGDEVIVSDFSFPASANVIENLGAIPIFVDVDLDTFNMNPKLLVSQITPRTKAVIFVDALGNPSNLLEIKNICANKGIPLIEDGACSIGSSIQNEKIGNIADLTCFSFHPRKLLTTGEGGAILTNNETWNHQLNILLNHGATIRDTGFDFIYSGFNYRLSDISCLLGIHQLNKLDDIIQRRQSLHDLYEANLTPLGFQAQKVNKDTTHNKQSVVFKTPPSIDRDKLINYLFVNHIEATMGTYSLSNTSFYTKKYQQQQINSAYLQKHTITLPCHDDVPAEKVIEKIVSFHKKTSTDLK
ncbi:DegT/DnrJ/EryC1/StrS family aminotransferase [Alkalihalobacillus pseudalcaliphilus]|uniref:DegT/DnrJ/EryC1/StrS family aminotransferase n=1 Tax=Alkalihalobacillus pseudalcaliphilus TaxID=79884 RepID=UPI00064DE15D|nr:DegT/DnrJ/EryC1/StrS family aminotransferase [Alkalihalobacillus pseudalcaliphilus]KMK77327.1 spore coat protein [Alkalihalobacillus pseudalcaliphilus]